MHGGPEFAASDQLTELIERAQRLESRALDELVELYSLRLYGFVYRIIGSRHDAEELVQELFLRLVRTLPNYRHDGRFEAWLFQIAVNLVRDRLRRLHRNRSTVSLDEPGYELCESSDGAATRMPVSKEEAPAASLERNEELDRLQAAIARLPQPEREVILLRHYGELSFAEIAELMETPLGTALARAHRGLAKLRGWMENAP
jgi:RNA polymerase sigma-70 factor (ECF subfamily)